MNSADEDILVMLPSTVAGLLVGGVLIALSAAEAPAKPVFVPMPGQHFTVARIT